MRNDNFFRNSFLKDIIENSRTWQKAVMGLAVIVVFVATYMLILPAITLDEKTASDQGGIDVQTKQTEAVSDASASSNDDNSVSGQDSKDSAKGSSSDNSSSGSSASDSDGNGDGEGKAGGKVSDKDEKSSLDKDADGRSENDSPSDSDDPSDSDNASADSDAADSESDEDTASELISKTTELSFEGEGFTVSAVCTKDTELPQNTELKVIELKEKDKDYDTYYEKTLAALQKKDGKSGKARITGDTNSSGGSNAAGSSNAAGGSVDADNSNASGASVAKGSSDASGGSKTMADSGASGAYGSDITSLRSVRFYDISFVSDGEEVEPASSVDMKISYDVRKALNIKDKDNIRIIHFTKENFKKNTFEVEILDDQKTDFETKKVSKDQSSRAQNNKDSESAGNGAKANAGEDGRYQLTQAGFETESFSTFAVAEFETLEKTVITADGRTYKVSVSYDQSSGIPEGSELEVSELTGNDHDDYLDKTAKALNIEKDQLSYAKFLDISIVSGGKEIEPASDVDVKIQLLDRDGNAKDVRTQVVHFAQNDKAEVIDAEIEENEVSFETEGFSVYAVVDENTTVEESRMTLNFYNGDNLIATVYVKNDDDTDAELEQIIYDPGAGTLNSGELFKGWILDKPDYTTEDASSKMDIDDIRTWAKKLANSDSITEGEVHNFYAMVYKTYAVIFKDEDGATIHSEALIFKSGDTPKYTINVNYTPKKQDEDFQGWNTANNVTATDGTTTAPFPNGTEVNITEDTTFTVNVPSGYWLSFSENGAGATYTPPQFIPQTGDTVTVRPSNPTRFGYTFSGWYTNPECTGNQFTFGDKLSGRTVLYAKWTPVSNADYTVIIWRQNLAGDGYDFEESIRLNGRVGTNVNTVTQQGTGNNAYARVNGVNKQFSGFHLKEFDQNVEIVPEGNAVVNVYYDRTEYTLTFQVQGGYAEATDNSGTQYGLVDGEYVQLTRSGYYNYTWSYQKYTYTPTTSNNGTQYGLVDGEYVELTRWGSNWYYDFNRYNGTRYTRSSETINYTGTRYKYTNDWVTIHTLTAKYQQDISNEWSFTGSNGVSYPQTNPVTSWQPVGSQTYQARITRIETMPDESITFHHTTTNNETRYFHYYVETVDGATGSRQYNGKQYDLYTDLPNDFNIVYYNDDFWNLNGFSRQVITKSGNQVVNLAENSNISWTSLNNNYGGQDNHLYFYYTRDKYVINFMDGVYVDGNGSPIDEPNHGQWDTSPEIYYQADISSYNTGGVNYYEPTKDGYAFEGWYIDDACTQPYNFTTMPKDGVTVYAKWRKIQYRVFMHPDADDDPSLNWGGQSMSYRINDGEKVAGGNNIQGTRDDYELIGWYTDEACTKPFNFDAFVLNDQTVTTPYDQTEPTELDRFGNPTDSENKDAANNRFWITKKLDLYAKWRAKLEGANGINVVYDAVAGDGKGTGTFSGGSTTYTDPLAYYLDRAEATATAASTPNDDTEQFMYWVIQRWDEAQHKYVDTEKTVYPGDVFEVLKDNAQVTVTEWVDPDNDQDVLTVTDPSPGTTPPDATHTKIKTASYIVQLRAEYGDKEGPTPSHIYFYANTQDISGNPIPGVTEALEPKDETTYANVQINEAKDILSINRVLNGSTLYNGYTFLGWAKSRDATTPWLKLNSDGTTYTVTQNGETYTSVTRIAADEVQPYDNLYALWAKSYKVKVTKIVDSPVAGDAENDYSFTANITYDRETSGKTFDLTGAEGNNTYEITDVLDGSSFSLTEDTSSLDEFEVSVTGSYIDPVNGKTDIADLTNGSSFNIQGDTELVVTNKRKTFDVDVEKVDKADSSPISGAVFQLSRRDLGSDETAMYERYQSDITLGSGTLNLIDGEYELTESDAPAGYQITTNTFYFTVGTDGSITVAPAKFTDGTDIITLTPGNAGTNPVNPKITIKNEAGVELPHTGGLGTLWLYVVGAILVIGSGITLLTRRRIPGR